MKVHAALVFASALVVAATPSRAGVYADDLSRCMVEHTSAEDRGSLVRWMFASAAANPAVSDIAHVTPEQLDAANKALADIYMRLLTDSCRAQAKKAIAYEGAVALTQGFQVLGQVAGRDLYSSPQVIEAMGGLEKYTDKQKLEELAKP